MYPFLLTEFLHNHVSVFQLQRLHLRESGIFFFLFFFIV